MDIRFSIPDGYILEGLTEVRPEGFWRCYLRERVRSPALGRFLGAVGRTPQEAADKVIDELGRIRQTLTLAKPAGIEHLTIDDLDF